MRIVRQRRLAERDAVTDRCQYISGGLTFEQYVQRVRKELEAELVEPVAATEAPPASGPSV
jgi:hypothetical protein